MLFEQIITTTPFKQWILENKENKKLLWFSLITAVISFVWLKVLYPFPNFMPPDSISYIEAADKNDFINMWAIGYSKFLRLVSIFSKSDMLLVGLQFLLVQLSILYFLFSLRYLLLPGKWVFRVLLTLSIANPLLLHIANFVSSDCLFIALSITWFTQLFWLLHQPSAKLIVAHAVVLLFAFMVRYNALYYPFISLATIGFASMHKRKKVFALVSTISLLLIFVACTQYEYYKKTGTTQFSAFAGWQLAANALYGYANSEHYPASRVPSVYTGLHEIVNEHMNSLDKELFRPDTDIGIYYLWDQQSPLWKFFNAIKKNDTGSLFSKWAKMAPYYKDYGYYLITQNPQAYIRYFVWPNLRKYYVPPASFMVSYNLGTDTIDHKAAAWFGWQNNRVYTRAQTTTIQIVDLFSIPIAIINWLFLLNFVAFALAGGFKRSSSFAKRALTLMLIIWLSNLAFSVVVAPIELRYQLFPLFITFSFLCLIMGWLIKHAFLKQTATDAREDSSSLPKSLIH